VRPVAEW